MKVRFVRDVDAMNEMFENVSFNKGDIIEAIVTDMPKPDTDMVKLGYNGDTVIVCREDIEIS